MIVDTNALSALADENLPIITILSQAADIDLPVVTLGEYRYGISQSRYKSRYSSWLDGLIRDCRVLDIDQETTSNYAEIRLELKKLGKPIPTNDLWIAALCRQHSLPLLSRDGHFDAVPGIKRTGW